MLVKVVEASAIAAVLFGKPEAEAVAGRRQTHRARGGSKGRPSPIRGCRALFGVVVSDIGADEVAREHARRCRRD
jgi:hypothetical protein